MREVEEPLDSCLVPRELIVRHGSLPRVQKRAHTCGSGLALALGLLVKLGKPSEDKDLKLFHLPGHEREISIREGLLRACPRFGRASRRAAA
jgi:hypothetical protein